MARATLLLAAAAVMCFAAAHAQLSNPAAPAPEASAITGMELCGAAADSTCVKATGPAAMDLYPKDKKPEDTPWFTLGFELTGIEVYEDDGASDSEPVDTASFAGLACEQSTKQQVFDYLTQYVCRAETESENGFKVYVARVLSFFTKDKTVTWGSEDVAISANSIKDSWVFTFPDGFQEQVDINTAGDGEVSNGGVLHATWKASWSVPSTFSDFMDAGLAVDGAANLDPTKLSKITRNAAGSVTRVQVDALLSIDMAVPVDIGLATNDDPDADLEGITATAFARLRNDADAGAEKVAVDMAGGQEVPSGAKGRLMFPVKDANEYTIDPLFTLKPGALAKGSIDLKLAVYVLGALILLILLCCFYCCYRCCCKKKKPPADGEAPAQAKPLEAELTSVPISRVDNI